MALAKLPELAGAGRAGTEVVDPWLRFFKG
jgi:hypothetical protein